MYKIQKNGKRVKTPTFVFDLEEYKNYKETPEEIFLKYILPEKDKKYHGYKYQVISTKEKQTPKDEVSQDKEIQEKRNSFLSRAISSKFPKYANEKHTSGLCLSGKTDWKWCWCVMQRGTSVIVGQISGKFDTYEEAVGWIDKKTSTY